MRISDWSSDVCSSDLLEEIGVEDFGVGGGEDEAQLDRGMQPDRRASLVTPGHGEALAAAELRRDDHFHVREKPVWDLNRIGGAAVEVGRASGRERGCQFV